ncbi:hypothetical protein SIID45300_01655 [Candidatus Magnetaquicoccaceae bacterium FCR-1]|uniref:Transposase IS204/IS1001/IS1096/IS1165 DDE domain-containing protein n=1 Tax=Candidatus Magnetaquiglobus chichijimensis TaxID=3141448 RepID=A0ABQ0C8W7_9PROT
MDETASRRGHHYISLFFDMDKSQLLFATKGKDKETIKNHWDGVLNGFHSGLTTGLVEGFNSLLLQAAKARARGYRSDANFITMAYLIGGKLNFTLPT